jgi:4-amino-4-deoxy-L-arabinose transferase-like glycosyltransferase
MEATSKETDTKVGLLENRKFRFIIYTAIPLGAIFAVALFSRLYDLSSFPYFSPGYPVCGGLPDCKGKYLLLPGLYSDEIYNFFQSQNTSSIVSNFGGGPVASFMISLSTNFLGTTSFAVRMPFALISSFTTLLVYLTTRMLTGGGERKAALASALYFIVMMPALVYGRMAFGENLIGLLFMINIYSTLKIKYLPAKERRRRLWFFLAGLSAALSVVVKFDGLIVAIYFAVFIFKEGLFTRRAQYVTLALLFGIASPLVALELITRQAFAFVMERLYPFAVEVGTQLGFLNYFLFETLPSGATVSWSLFDRVPEYWYIILFVALVALLINKQKQYYDLIFPVGVFLAFFAIFSGSFGSYYLIMIQPILAVGFGPGFKQLLRLPPLAALLFYALLFMPLVTSVGEVLFTPNNLGSSPIFNSSLFAWNLLIALPIGFLLLLSTRIRRPDSKWRVWINGTLLVSFVVVLLVATFLTADLYPYYVKGII